MDNKKCENCQEAIKHGYKACNSHGIIWYTESNEKIPEQYREKKNDRPA